jgi:hypothetical protein
MTVPFLLEPPMTVVAIKQMSSLLGFPNGEERRAEVECILLESDEENERIQNPWKF